MITTDRARNRIRLLDRYADFERATASYKHLIATGMSAVQVKEQVDEIRARLQTMAIQHAVMTDLLKYTSPADRCMEEADKRTTDVILAMAEEDKAKKQRVTVALEVSKKEQVSAAQI